jgi:predicted RNA-binding Zn ribbon-like protein
VIVDLTNTVSWRLDPDRIRDQLTTFDTLLSWLVDDARLLDASSARRLAALASRDPRTSAHALEGVRALREQLYLALRNSPGAEQPVDQTLAPLRRTFVDAIKRASVEPTLPLRWRLTVEEPDDIVRLLALTAIELLRSTHVLRIRQCAGEGCGWLFLDHSRNQSRRWCSSADCGNRHRVKNHYVRTRSGGSSRA